MKHKIITLIKENCIQNKCELNNANTISEVISLSRNEVASILNDLNKNGILIKIESKPIIYLDKEVLMSEGYILDKNIYKNINEITKNNINKVNDFDKLVGCDGSLKELVKQCKATIAYPPSGLAMMLHGESGTGKSYIAKLAFEYAVNQQLIEKEGKFIALNCSEYANNPELLTANLFGHVKGAFTGADKDNPGLIALADGGILFLDEVHNLKSECQEKLFQFMDQSIFHRVGDNEKWYQSNVRLIFATTEDPEKVLLRTLLRRIPMTITVSSLEERGMQEKIQLILQNFVEEEKRLNKKIKLSSKVYSALLAHVFKGNIGELKACVQSCCVNSLFDVNENNEMLIHLNNLPKHIIEEYQSKVQVVSNHIEYIEVTNLQDFIHKEKEIICLNDTLIQKFILFKDEKISKLEVISQLNHCVQQYIDKVLFKKEENNKSDYHQKAIQNVLNLVANQYGIKILNNDVLALTSYINDYHRNYHSFRNWNQKYQKESEELLQLLMNENHRENMIAHEICKYLSSYMDCNMLNMVEVTILIFLIGINKEKDFNKRIAVILAHGFSTASSISDAANKFLGAYVFDAIDMPVNVDTNTIINKLNTYLCRVGKYDELFLLVDMGSLEEIYKGIEGQNANIGIINNISTKAALEIGNGIIQEKDMESIFKDVMKYMNSSYHIEKNKHKEQVILCSCASGMGTAEKLRVIIKDSLPVNINIVVKTYNYNELIEKGTNSSFFEDYNVICVIGTLNPNIKELNFIPIEDLIINDNLDELDQYLKDNMSYDQLEVFKKNILRNFSLSNIMNNLTILNPNKLLEHVAEAIDKLQIMLDIKLSNNTCFGLYVHICCLIERLVIQKGIENYHEIDDFEIKHKDFILHIKQTFKDVEIYYGVEITIAEIGYIYDYIKNN